jgi:hypothetical protein
MESKRIAIIRKVDGKIWIDIAWKDDEKTYPATQYIEVDEIRDEREINKEKE